MKYDKGARVQIKPGNNGAGVCGEVFWKGPKKWGDGERLGLRGDDGETYWIDDDCVEATDKAAAPDPGQTFSKGDRVTFKNRGQTGQGTVFWIGESRNGPGQRLGINDDAGEEAVWLDARFARPLSPDEDSGAPAQSSRGSGRGSRRGAARDDDDDGAPWTPPIDVSRMPAPPPIDDSLADSWAAGQDDEDDDDVPW
jgi:hypothetical protein